MGKTHILLNLVSNERINYNFCALQYNKRLINAANVHAYYMVQYSTFGHVGSNESNVGQRVQ